MKLSENFILQEFVPQVLWTYKGESSIWFLDQRLIWLVQFFRNYFGKPITLNDWMDGGKLNDCGFRLPDSKTGAVLSQHKFGRAADLHFEGITNYDTIRQEIKDNWPLFKAEGLTTIEDNTDTWLHIDIRHTGLNKLLIVPNK